MKRLREPANNIRQDAGADVIRGTFGIGSHINSIEIAIPWTTIGVAANAGKQIRFDIGINDDDNGGARDGKAVGLGTANDFQNTSAFGTIQLDGAFAPTAVRSKVISPRDTPAIDGHLGEPAWNFNSEAHKLTTGSISNRLRWAVTYSDDYLLVAAAVKDASLRNDSTNVRDDDSVEIYIDGQHNKSATCDANDLQFTKGYNDGTILEKNGRTSGVLHASAPLPGGYGVELAIPWARLGFAARPPINTVIGFDIAVNDDQNGGARDGASVCFGDSNNGTSTAKVGDLNLGQ